MADCLLRQLQLWCSMRWCGRRIVPRLNRLCRLFLCTASAPHVVRPDPCKCSCRPGKRHVREKWGAGSQPRQRLWAVHQRPARPSSASPSGPGPCCLSDGRGHAGRHPCLDSRTSPYFTAPLGSTSGVEETENSMLGRLPTISPVKHAKACRQADEMTGQKALDRRAFYANIYYLDQKRRACTLMYTCQTVS